MTDSMVERVARALMDARSGCYVNDWKEAEWNPYVDQALKEARAAIEAMRVEQMLINAYVRGVEWNEENPLDREYRFKAAGDYADFALSQAQPTGEKT